MSPTKKKSHTLFKVVLGTLIVVQCLILALFGVEMWLNRPNPQQTEGTYFQQLQKAYAPFTVQHINPFYTFFFPLDLNKRRSMNNPICSVDDNGFRGKGMERRGERKLAILLGGSTAFGHYSSSDSTTIDSWLNRMQDEYWFVNAGVPSWNSTQAMFRYCYQIILLKPELVIMIDGGIDAGLAIEQEIEYRIIPGVSENFAKLYNVVDDINKGIQSPKATEPIYKRALPRVSKWIGSKLPQRASGGSQAGAENTLGVWGERQEKGIRLAVERYIANHEIVARLCQSNGTRYIGIFAPIRSLHRNVRDADKRSGIALDPRWGEKVIPKFHQQTIDSLPAGIEYYDMGSFFDSKYDTIPVYQRGTPGPDKHIFIDEVHLFDPGNKLVAEQIWQWVKQGEKTKNAVQTKEN